MTRRLHAKLTPREEQRIIALRAEGLTFAVSAARIGCSKGTVWNALHACEPTSAPLPGSTEATEHGGCTGALATVSTLLLKKLEVGGRVVHAVDVGDGMDGIMSEDEMVRHLGVEVISYATEAT